MLKYVIVSPSRPFIQPYPHSDVMSLVVALYAIKVIAIPFPHTLPDLSCVLAGCVDRDRFPVFLRLASGRNPCRSRQWCLPLSSLFLHLSGGLGTIL